MAGQHCVVCPWHQYKVQLATGEKVYEESAGVWKRCAVCRLRLAGVK